MTETYEKGAEFSANHRLEMDMRDVRLFPGAARLATRLVDSIVEQCVWGRADITLIHRIDTDSAPELSDLGVQTVQFHARLSVAEDFPAHRKRLKYGMQSVFSLLQYPEQRQAVFSGGEALIFYFSDETWLARHYLMVEFVPESHFLRMTMERKDDSRLNLAGISHRAVLTGDRFLFLPDRERAVLELFQSIHNESHKQQTEYDEIPQRQKALFDNLKAGGMADLGKMKFHWSNPDIPMILDISDRTTQWFLDKLLFLLEQRDVLRELAAGRLLHVRDTRYSAFIDLSQGGKVLNISLNRPRSVREMNSYADRMPQVGDWINAAGACMAGVRVFLIHHMTSEILGMIHGMDRLSAAFLHVLFVKYQGLVPDSFLESIGALPLDRFQFHGLRRLRSESSVEGQYRLSDQYSPLTGLSELETALKRDEQDFFAAMRLTAGHLFFRDAVQAKQQGESMLLVEDGGYLAPEINRLSLENRTLGEALSRFSLDSLADKLPPSERDLPLKEWLAPFYVGSVEHTRNGFDYLEAVEARFGKLAFPAVTIAISRLKRGEEAMGTSVSIVHAVESILHGLGKMLCYRNVIVIGCRGAIGRNLMREFENRLSEGRVAGVDLACEGATEGGIPRESRNIEGLGEELLREADLFVGVTGKSAIQRDFLEWLLLNTTKKDIYFASGSTKTVEFAALIQLLQDIRSGSVSAINGVPVRLNMTDIRDPQTGVIQGSRYRLRMGRGEKGDGNRTLNIHLLAGGMPVNFLYYGVPSEMFDRVLKQLMQLSCWLVAKTRAGQPLPARLLALDREIQLAELDAPV